MRIETKLVKQILNKEFPNSKFKIKTIKPSSYVNSSDKIRIMPLYKCGHTCEQFVKCLNKYTSGISVGFYGTILCIGGEYNSKIFDIKLNEWIDVDAEFIEVYR